MRPPVDPKRTNLRAVVADLRDPEGGFVDYAAPGSITPDTPAAGYLMLACPGCGRVSGMAVGDPKPPNGNGATWRLTGPADAPTLEPSVNCVGCCGWHGWLKGGVFASC